MFQSVESHANSLDAFCALKKATWSKLLKWCFKGAKGPENQICLLDVMKNDTWRI
jgi:hypothetical protein